MAKRKYVPWLDWEEENLLPWVTEHQSLSWDERAAKYRRQYCTNRSSESLRSKCNQLLEGIRRRRHIRSRWSEASPLLYKHRRTRRLPPAQRPSVSFSLLHIPPPPKLVIPRFRTSALSLRAPTPPRSPDPSSVGSALRKMNVRRGSKNAQEPDTTVSMSALRPQMRDPPVPHDDGSVKRAGAARGDREKDTTLQSRMMYTKPQVSSRYSHRVSYNVHSTPLVNQSNSHCEGKYDANLPKTSQ